MIVEHYCERMHGNQKYILMLSGVANRKSGNTVICVVRRNSVLQNELLEAGVSVIGYAGGLKGVLDIIKALRKNSPDSILANNERSMLKAFIGKVFGGSRAKLVWFVKNSRKNIIADIFAGFFADRILFISRSLLDHKGRLFNALYAEKSDCIPILVEVSELSNVSEPVPDGLRILVLSSITPMKGIGVFIEALELLDRKEVKGITVRILGATPKGMEDFRSEIEARVEKLSTVKVVIDDWSRDVVTLMSDSNLFVLPSFMEGVPRSITEAMQAGRAVIATRVGGVPDIVENGENGVIVNPGDPVELAAAIQSYIDNPDLLVSHGKRSREMYYRKFDNNLHFRALFDVDHGSG